MPRTWSTSILTPLRDVSDFAAAIGFPYRTLIDPLLVDLLESISGRETSDPLRHLVPPLRRIARFETDATRVRFFIRPTIGEREWDTIPIVAAFQSDQDGDYFTIMLNDALLESERE
jgi:hypothetical protein